MADSWVFFRAGAEYSKGIDPYYADGMPFVHGPLSLPIYKLFASLNIFIASLIWELGVVLCGLLLAYLLHNFYGIKPLHFYILLTLTAPLRTTLGNGQVAMLVAVAIVLAMNYEDLTESKIKYLVLIFSVLVILTLKPYLIIPVALKLAINKRYIPLYASSLGSLFSFTVLGLGLTESYFRALIGRGNDIESESTNYSFSSLLNTVTDWGLVSTLVALFIGVLALATLLKNQKTVGNDWVYFLSPFLVSPFVHSQDLVLMLIPLVSVTTVRGNEENWSWQGILALSLLSSAFTNFGLYIEIVTTIFFVFYFKLRKNRFIVVSPIPVSLLANDSWRSDNLAQAYFLYGSALASAVILVCLAIYKQQKFPILN